MPPSSTEDQPGVVSGVLTADGRLGGPNWPRDEEGNPISVPAGIPAEVIEALTPEITSLAPNTAVVGSTDFTLRVLGMNFQPDAVIVFNGGEEPTTFVSSTELTTGIKPSLASGPSTVPVLVRNKGLLDSNPLDFTFTAA